jgi:hypothetical protein
MTRACLLFALAACDGELTAEGTHHHYVIDKLQLPASADDLPRFAIDLDGSGTKDNKLGGAFAALGASGFDANIGDNFDIAAGNVLLLVDYQTIDYTEAPASGIRVLFGANPSPTPCTTATDCGHHLTGTGSFDLGFQSRDVGELVGTIRGGTFTSAAGSFSIQLSLGGGTQSVFAHEVPLVGARVEVTAASDSALSGVIGGAIPRDKMMELASSLALDLELVSDACSVSGCTCATTYARNLLNALDANGDCILSTDEAAAAFAGVSDADLSIAGEAAISFGVGFHAVPGTFDD